MRLKFTRLITTILLLALIGSVPSFAQVNSASLTGLILDPNGAAIANATVKAKNKATNVEQSVKTDSSGYYTFASLPVGTYSLTVETQGFKRAVREEVDLEVGQRARLDFNLEVGAVSEAVLVTADTPMLTTQEASTGGVVENKLISDLPLAARNWDDLLALVPGVQADRFTEQSGGTANGRTGGANVHGVRSLQNNFVLDGVDNNSFSENVQELTTQIVRPSVDSIQEFKVSTNLTRRKTDAVLVHSSGSQQRAAEIPFTVRRTNSCATGSLTQMISLVTVQVSRSPKIFRINLAGRWVDQF